MMSRRSEWITDLRKTALLNSIFCLLSALVPVANTTTQVMALMSDHPDMRIWLILGIIATTFLLALIFTFFWAVYRDRAVALPDHLRILALGAVLVLIVIGYRTFGDFAFGIREDWSFLTHRDWRAGV